MTLLDEALAWHAAGYTPVPIQPNGQKRPIGTWKHLQDQQPTAEAVKAAFAKDTDGIGLICGTRANLEMFEAEGRAVNEGYIPRLAQAFADHELTELWEKITAGYTELTPSGGLHWYYTTDGARGNTKLARRPAIDEELAIDPQDKIKVLFETRGQGGFSVIAPSNGRTHASGKPWQVIKGDRDTIPHLTADERDALYLMANTFDQMPDIDPPPVSQGSGTEGILRAGDDYNARATWQEILGPHGWKISRHFGGNLYGWQRPGKHHPGTSATTGKNEHDRLYVFSTSTEFQEERPYSKFAAYALLEHGNDFKVAAKALGARGYGDPLPEPSRVVNGTEGILATVHTLPEPAQRPVAIVNERTLLRSDDGNALQLIDRFGDLIRYVPELGRWLAWDHGRWDWCPSNDGIVREYAKRVARALDESDQPAQLHKKKSLSANGTTAMIAQAETDDRITTRLAQLDADPYALNTPSGPVDLRTGHIGTNDPALMHTRTTLLTPSDQLTPRWLAFLADTFEGTPDLQPFAQRLAGYSATGNVTHHILPFLHGPGGNGKSVFLDVIRALLGSYAGAAPAKFLMAGQQQHETEIARLSGLRMVICSEINQNDKFDEAKVKILTGGDTLTARFMRQDHFDFKPTHHLWLMGNHQPKVTGGGESFWRRLRMLRFINVISELKKIDNLAEILISEEGPGILAWIIDGARAVLADGLHAPASVMVATKTYAEEEDTLARFINDRCHIGGAPHVTTATATLRGEYEKWCQQEGETAFSPQVFGRELRARFDIEQSRSNGRRFYVGISVTVEDPATEWFK